ncbi:hypothetical protein AnigIFM63326_003662 [Aspergillus niger]|nr:hypothetical protein AnigIFM63326_003662 [Aspergillus niger]
MYGAILRPSTELVESGDAHIGVLFTHNGGLSTMCGHATIALGRFLIDTHDVTVFPKRKELVVEGATQTVVINLHAPCGLVRITVPVKETADEIKSDPSRAVSFLSTPGYAAATNLVLPIPPEIRWSELEGREDIALDVSYGGAFYALINMRELGFASTGLGKVDLDSLSQVMKKLKNILKAIPIFWPPVSTRRTRDYHTCTPSCWWTRTSGSSQTEFPERRLDCVTLPTIKSIGRPQVRVSQLEWPLLMQRVRDRLVSGGLTTRSSPIFQMGGFEAEIVETGLRVEGSNVPAKDAVVVRVQGRAYYTGMSSFMVEEGDVTSHGEFVVSDMTQ